MKYCVLGNIVGFKPNIALENATTNTETSTRASTSASTSVNQSKCNEEQSHGKKEAKKKPTYILDYAPTSANVAALATWYTVEKDGSLKSKGHSFIDLKYYLIG